MLNIGQPRFPRPPQTLALQVTEMLKSERLLFRMGKELGEVDPATGEWEPMDPHRFVTWIKNTANIMPISGYAKENGTPIEAGLGVEQARVILRSNELRVKMPVIERINHVKLPTQREALDERGLRRLDMLKPGYDAETKTFTTLRGPDYDEHMDFQHAANLIYSRFMHFSWRDRERDWPIHLAAMLSMFCHNMVRARAPMFVYNANIVESGKTICAWFSPWITHGSMDSRPLPEDSEERLIDTLDTLAKERSPYLLFDNVEWGNKEIRSSVLDEFLTKRDHVFRVKGVSQQHRSRLELITLLTGNKLKLSQDLQGRSLICDLWNPLPAEERPPLPEGAIVFDDEYFENDQARSDYLAAFYALVRSWDKAGRPQKPGRGMSRFPTWSRVVPSIVWHVGQESGGREWDCLKASGNKMVGDQTSQEYRELAQRAISEFGEDKTGGIKSAFEVSVAQLAGIARRYQIATDKLWPEKSIEDVRATENEKGGWKYKRPAEKFELTADDADAAEELEKNRQASEWLGAKSRSSFGIALTNKIHDLQFKGDDGCQYLFKHVPNSAPTVYRVTRASV